MTYDRPNYQSYMLRLWQAPNQGEKVWLASLEDPHTGERLGFASLDALVAYLRERTAAAIQNSTHELPSGSTAARNVRQTPADPRP